MILTLPACAARINKERLRIHVPSRLRTVVTENALPYTVACSSRQTRSKSRRG